MFVDEGSQVECVFPSARSRANNDKIFVARNQLDLDVRQLNSCKCGSVLLGIIDLDANFRHRKGDDGAPPISCA